MKIDFDKLLDPANIQSTATALRSDFSLYLIFFFRLLYGIDFTFLPFHKKICEALESYVFGTNKKKNLVISMSPRSGKSVIMQFFITWGFIHNPKSNFIFTSYQEQVCNRTSDDILAIMRHPVWQKMFGVKLSSTTQAKELWETAAKGGFRSAPIESAITSFGCFDYDTLVECENGFEKIGKLVEDKPSGLKVWGMKESGERVLSEVVDYVYNNEDKYLRIEIEGGEVIEATTDHIFYTSEGLKRGYELRVGELLSSNLSSNSCNDSSGDSELIANNTSWIVFIGNKLSFFRSKLSFIIRFIMPTSLKSKANSFFTPQDSTFNIGDSSRRNRKFLSNLFIRSGIFCNKACNSGRNFAISIMSAVSNAILFIVRLSSIGKIFRRVIKRIAVKMPYLHTQKSFSNKCKGYQGMNPAFNSFSILNKVYTKIIFPIFVGFKNFIRNRRIDTSGSGNKIPFKMGYRRIKSIVNIHNKPSYCLSVKNVNNFFITHSKILVHNCGVHGDEWGGCVVIDDALNPLFFNSEVKKRIVKESYETVFSKRLNNPTKTPIIIIMQRVAVDDLVGYVLEKYRNDFEVIKVPALDDTVNPPRSFWESQFPVEMLLKEQLANPAVFAAQRQQEPVLYNGNMFKAEWFKFYHYVPGTQYREVFMASDTAFRSSETADNTAIGLWGRTMDTNRLHLIDLLYGKISSEELVRKFMTFYRTWNGRVGNRQRITSVWIEDAASGMRLIEDLRRLGGIPVRRFKPRGRDKMMRVMDMKPMIESGNILFPENASHRVSQAVMKELLLLTEDGKAKHDDIADMIAQAAEVAYNRRGGF